MPAEITPALGFIININQKKQAAKHSRKCKAVMLYSGDYIPVACVKQYPLRFRSI